VVHEKVPGVWLSAWPFQKQLPPSGSKINSNLELIKVKSKSGGCIYGYPFGFMGCFVCYQLWIRWIGRVFLARGIRSGQKRWWTLLGREISCSQLEGLSMHSRCLAFLPFKFWVGLVGKDFIFIFPLFLMCS